LEDELLKSATRAWTAARDFGAQVMYDCIGVGASVGGKFKELNEQHNQRIDYDAFNAGGGVMDPDGIYLELPHMNILNKDHFSGIKSQAWDSVATKFRKTYEAIKLGVDHDPDELISLDSSALGDRVITQLAAELSAPKKDNDLSGRFRVEQKIAMRKRGIKSPNIADALIMAFTKPKRKAAGFFDM
jgi:phage terminase large subunit